ncbi:MAG: hypothetical protein ACK5LR_06485 [Mangrovibacterium sp.]
MKTTELTCEYLTEQEIFKITLEGPIDGNRIVATWEYIFRHKLVPEGTKRYLFDNRMAISVETFAQHPELGKIYKKHASYFKNARIAVITRCPQIIVSVLSVQNEFPAILHERFQTTDGAIAWLAQA